MADAPNFDRLNVTQLRDSCERRGLSSAGLKKELIARLKEHEETQVKDEDMKEEEEVKEEKPEVKEEQKEEMQTDQAEENGEAEANEEKAEEAKTTEETTEKKDENVPSDTLPDGKPKNLGRQKFAFGYMKMLSMKSVVIYPFKPEIFQNSVFVEYLEKAVNYAVKNTKHSKTSGLMLEFEDVDAGDDAWKEIHRALSEDEDLTIEHPDFHSDSTFWSHRVDTSIDWFLNLCVLKEMEIRDLYTKRVVLMENVPECTHAELIAEFPEARHLTNFASDPDCPGCVGVECFSIKRAEEFIAKYNEHEFKGQKVFVEWYNVRFNRFDKVVRRYRKEHPEVASTDNEPMTDEERLAKVKDYAALNDAKKTIDASYEYSGSEKIKKCQELSETQVPIARHLFQDAKRRHESGLEIPEPAEEQTAMVKNLLEGKLDKRKERAQEGNKAAAAKEKWAKDKTFKKQPQQQKKPQQQAGKRPAGSGQHLSGYPPHKKFQGKSPGRDNRGQNQGRTDRYGSGGNERGYNQRGYNNRGNDMNMSGGFKNRGYNDRSMGGDGGNYGRNNRDMGGRGNFNDMRGGGFRNQDMGMGMDMGMGRSMMNPSRGGNFGGGDLGMGMGGGMDMGGMSSVTKTVQALTDKVRELEMLTNRGGGGGGAMGMGGMGGGNMGGGGGRMGGGSYNELRGHRGHQDRQQGRRW